MTFFPTDRSPMTARRSHVRGSVLIIVLWVAFGLASIALYFAHSMTFELRASETRVASLEAEQAIAGAARYVNYLLTNLATNGAVPDPTAYQREAALVGEARSSLIGRGDHPAAPAEPSVNLVDDASKLTINTATHDQL